jgi:hypothetical protein
MAYHHGKSWTERTGAADYPEARDDREPYDIIERHSHAQGFHNPHTSLGVAGHVVHMGAMLFPVLAAELITDAEKYRKAVRVGAVATAVLYEGLYTMREAQRRERQEAKLAECRNEHAEHHER